MWVVLGLVFLLYTPSLCVENTAGDEGNVTEGLWQPVNGTREEAAARWGMSQEDFDLVIERLKLLTKIHREQLEAQQAFKNQGGHRNTSLTEEDIDYREVGLEAITTWQQLDMMLYDSYGVTLESSPTPITEHRRKRKIMNYDVSPGRKWDHVYYKIDADYNSYQRALINFATAVWESLTCVQFTEVDLNENMGSIQHIQISKLGGCWSVIGIHPLQNPQLLSLDNGCLISSFGTPAHEFGHAIGLIHEQAREDRDSYLTINWENIITGMESQFDMNFAPSYVDMGVRYDYGSIMQYTKNTFANGNGDTMTPVDATQLTTMGQDAEISFYDAKVVNLAYCTDVCTEDLPCENEGYTDPKDCSKCRCPDNYRGQLCQDPIHMHAGAPGCVPLSGEIIVEDPPVCMESPNFQNGAGHYLEEDDCHWFIKAGCDGCTLLFWFDSPNDFLLYAGPACMHWVEIQYNEDHRYRGRRFCGSMGYYYGYDNRIMTEMSNVTVNFRSPVLGMNVDPQSYFRGFRLCFEIIDQSCFDACPSPTTTSLPVTSYEPTIESDLKITGEPLTMVTDQPTQETTTTTTGITSPTSSTTAGTTTTTAIGPTTTTTGGPTISTTSTSGQSNPFDSTRSGTATPPAGTTPHTQSTPVTPSRGAPNTGNNDGLSDADKGAIAGGVIGGIALAAGAGVLVFLAGRKKRSKEKNRVDVQPEAPNHGTQVTQHA